MRGRDERDVWTAIVIGAVVGIGATLLLRARQDDAGAIIKALRPVKKRASRVAQDAGKVIRRSASHVGKTGEDFASAGRDVLSDLRDDATEIVRDTRRELRKAAHDSLADARKAARRTFR